MITNRGKLTVTPNVDYITKWVDGNGQYVLDHYFSRGRYLLNKQVTGCGFTTYCLRNNYHTIIVSPRLRLIQDKIGQPEFLGKCFYFNREKKSNKTPLDLQFEFGLYQQYCKENNLPMKILVTYDSFDSLSGMLENFFGLDVNRVFRIVIDESHCLIKDVRMKENVMNQVLSKFLRSLFRYENLLFVSATPVCEYMSQIPEFQRYQVDYYELEFGATTQINLKTHSCKSPVSAFDDIYKYYKTHTDQGGRHFFDVIYEVGCAVYSYEAVIFLNSIQDIRKILRKYITKQKYIDPANVTIICADTPENEKIIKGINTNLSIASRIPKENERHNTFTFVTRTAFEGVDFCSSNASTYVIANYNVDSLSLDIASDLPQIVGRQRLKYNLFRTTIHMYYTDSKSDITENEFDTMLKKKEYASLEQIGLYNDASPERKNIALQNLIIAIGKSPKDYCLRIVNDRPEINPMIIANERYCKDIIKNYKSLMIMSSVNTFRNNLSEPAQELLNLLDAVFSDKAKRDRIKIAFDYFMAYPHLQNEFFAALRDGGYNDIGTYFMNTSMDRIVACGFDPWKIDKEIIDARNSIGIENIVASRFISGQTYSKQEVKRILQEVYLALGLNKTAKANDIEKLIGCKIVKKDNKRAYRIL